MLVAQAHIDREYAVKLEELSLAFSVDVNPALLPPSTRPTRVDSGEDGSFMGADQSSSTDPAREVMSDETAVLLGADCFLASASESNATTASLWRDFSALLAESMIQGEN